MSTPTGCAGRRDASARPPLPELGGSKLCKVAEHLLDLIRDAPVVRILDRLEGSDGVFASAGVSEPAREEQPTTGRVFAPIALHHVDESAVWTLHEGSDVLLVEVDQHLGVHRTPVAAFGKTLVPSTETEQRGLGCPIENQLILRFVAVPACVASRGPVKDERFHNVIVHLVGDVEESLGALAEGSHRLLVRVDAIRPEASQRSSRLTAADHHAHGVMVIDLSCVAEKSDFSELHVELDHSGHLLLDFEERNK